MTNLERERLIRVEDHQTEMTRHIEDIKVTLIENSNLTMEIKTKLDELTGAKRLLMWITGTVVAAGAAVGAWFGTGGRH